MNNSEIQRALEFHEATKHSYWGVRHDPHFLDWANQPIPYKIYQDAPTVPLPDFSPSVRSSSIEVLSRESGEVTGSIVPRLEELGHLLRFSAGQIKKKRYPGGDVWFRAASCTGALYEVEAYAVCGNLDGLSAGVYHFNPRDHVLDQLRSGDYRPGLAESCGRPSAALQAPIFLIFTGTYWRNAWKYRDRSYRHFGWDNGTILANLFALCSALGFPCRLLGGFCDEEVNELLDLDQSREVAFSVVTVGRQQESMPGSSPHIAPLDLPVVPLSAHEIDYPAMREIHQASCLKSGDEVRMWGQNLYSGAPLPEAAQGRRFTLDPIGPDKLPPETLEKTIMRRGSSRHFRREPLSFSDLSTILGCLGQPILSDFHTRPCGFLNTPYIIINAVEGLPSGAYVLDVQRRELELLKEGDFRGRAGYLGLEQGLAADASADVFFLCELTEVLQRLGNRGYRLANLEAGILGGRLYLAAYALHRGATGLTFYDNDVVEFFSPHAAGKSAIFLMAVGHGQKPAPV